MSYPFERFLNIRWAGGASLRSDGERLAFLTDITGTAQLWTLGGPMQWPRQLTFFENRLMFADYHPERPLIAFGKDQGGDEKQRIFAVEDKGGLSERLSPTDAKHMWGGWSRDGTMAAWAHNGRNGRDFDLYVFDMDTREEQCVWEGDGYNYVAGWIPDGDALLVGRAESNTNNNLWLLDIDTGHRLHLTPHQEDAFYANPVAHPDDGRIFLLSNENREFRNLAVYDLEADDAGAPETGPRFIDDHDWDRRRLAISDSGRHLAMTTNENGYSTLEIRDLEDEETHRIDAFDGAIVGRPRFQPGAERLVTAVSAPDDTTDVWTLETDDRTTRRWTRSSTAGIPRRTLVSPELIHYESFDGLEVPAFFYVHPDADPPYPVIMDIHGGPESQHRPTLRASTQYFLQRGFAVLAPNVRGSSGYGKTYMDMDNVRKRMDSVADIRAARDWLVQEGDAHPGRIGLIGGSYGGFMVLSSMVTYPDLWAGGVDIVGVANFVTFLENTSDYRRHLREAEYGSLEEDREFLEEISPLTHIDKIQAPLMVVHGENDPRVPVSEARQVVDALQERGVPVESLIYPDEGHGLAKRKNRLDAYPKVGRFFEEHLL